MMFYPRYKSWVIFFFIAVFSSCIGCAFCKATLENKTDSPVYVIIKSSDLFNVKWLKHSAKESHITHYMIDTIAHTGTFSIPPGGHLITYSGPGSDPAICLQSLKIVTQKNIIDLKEQSEIEDLFEKSGIHYQLFIRQ